MWGTGPAVRHMHGMESHTFVNRWYDADGTNNPAVHLFLDGPSYDHSVTPVGLQG